jgi:hypothetical protein
LTLVAGSGMLTAVPIRTGETIEAGSPRSLFHTDGGRFAYAVTHDGERFLMPAVEAEMASSITIVRFSASIDNIFYIFSPIRRDRDRSVLSCRKHVSRIF